MTEAPSEPKRIIHEVCRRATAYDSEVHVGNARYTDDDDARLLRIGIDGIVVVASVTLYEHESYDPPPWVRHGIDTKGWWIRRRNAPPTGLAFHGAVDWKSVAEQLAGALMKRKKPSQVEEAALDNFGIAMAEEALAMESAVSEPEPEPEGGDDDAEG